MRRFLFPLILLSLPVCSPAQQWSGILSPTRAADWSSSGVVGDIPSGSWTQCGSTIAAGASATTINNAIAACGANQFALLGPGTFNLSGCLNITKSNVVLRGSGADQTKLVFTGSCSGGGVGFNRSISLMSGAVGCGQNACTPPSQTATWSAGYAQGATTITLSNVSGLTAGAPGVGSIIMLDQLDDNNSGFPTVNDVIQCATQASWCSNQGGNQWGRSSRAQVQTVTVTAISGSGPFTVTISPGLAYPNWRSSQSPGAWWNNTQIHNSGLENFTLDTTATGTIAIFVKDISNGWIKGIRSINTGTGTSESYHIWTQMAAHLSIRSNYIWGKNTTCSPFPLANYAMISQQTSDMVVENTIWQHTNNAFVPNDPEGRNVYAYNYIVGNVIGAAGAQPHSGHMLMNLFEGNNWSSYYGDVTHGTHNFMTLFRNHFDGTANNNSCTVDSAIAFLTNNRFNNVVGNVFGSNSYGSYEVTTGTGSNAIFDLGTIGNNSGTPVNPDTNVKRTLMRWGNWDQVTSTNDTGTNDSTGTRFLSSEVPSGITNFPNAVPASQTLPASFYRSSKPSWFGTVPWPPIGPDVASGNAPNTAAAPTGGHANKIPARVCYENTAVDSAYSSLGIRAFNADACYAGGDPPPDPPSNLDAVVQ